MRTSEQTTEPVSSEPSPRRRAALGGGILAVTLALGAVIITTGPDGSPTVKEEKAWPVSVLRAAPGELHPMFATYGRVEARTTAKIRTDIQAEVQQVLVREGEWAEAGEVLVLLEPDDIELQLREATATVAQQEAVLEATQTEFEMLQKSTGHFEQMHRISQQKLTRQEELAARRMIPQALLDDALQRASRDAIEYQNHKTELAAFPSRVESQRATLERAATQLAQAQRNLEKTEVRAPFAGPVLEISVGPGDRSHAGIVLLTMADAASFEVRAAIPNAYADAIRHHLDAARPVTAALDTGGEPLHLTRISHSVRAGQSGLDAFFAPAFITDPEASVQLTPARLPDLGRVLNLHAKLPRESGLIALPSEALYDNDRVYQVSNNRLRAVSVERVGEHRGAQGEYQILVRADNLVEGEDILTTQLPKAINGLLVHPVRGGEEAMATRLRPQSSVAAAPAPTA